MAHVLLDEAQISVTTDQKVAKSLGLRSTGQFVLIRPLENKVIYKGKLNLQQVVAFFKQYRNQLVVPMRPDNVASIVQSNDNLFVGFIDNMESSQSSQFLSTLKQVATTVEKSKRLKFAFSAVCIL